MDNLTLNTTSVEDVPSNSSKKTDLSMEVLSVFHEYVNSPSEELYRSIVDKFKTLDKTIPDFSKFLQAKQYKKNFPSATDQDRYNNMISECVKYLSSSGSFDKYLSNKEEFFSQLDTFLSSEEIYETTSESFLKGSFKLFSEKIGRIFKPKDDDDPYLGFNEVHRLVKPYGLKFIEMFTETFSKEGCKMYMLESALENPDVTEDHVKAFVYKMCNDNYSFFSTYRQCETETNTTLKILVACASEITEYRHLEVSLDNFIKTLESEKYEPIYVDAFISMNSLKRLFVVKSRDTTNEIVELLNLLKRCLGLHLYQTKYKDVSSFNSLPEENLPNVLKGIVSGGKDYAEGKFNKKYPHGVLATFQLNGTVGNLEILGFWASIDPIELCVPEFDMEAFDWVEISLEEYVSKMKEQGSLFTEYLH